MMLPPGVLQHGGRILQDKLSFCSKVEGFIAEMLFFKILPWFCSEILVYFYPSILFYDESA